MPGTRSGQKMHATATAAEHLTASHTKNVDEGLTDAEGIYTAGLYDKTQVYSI